MYEKKQEFMEFVGGGIRSCDDVDYVVYGNENGSVRWR
jgi:hypothetical protein